jgi:hypothetical protein
VNHVVLYVNHVVPEKTKRAPVGLLAVEQMCVRLAREHHTDRDSGEHRHPAKCDTSHDANLALIAQAAATNFVSRAGVSGQTLVGDAVVSGGATLTAPGVDKPH